MHDKYPPEFASLAEVHSDVHTRHLFSRLGAKPRSRVLVWGRHRLAGIPNGGLQLRRVQVFGGSGKLKPAKFGQSCSQLGLADFAVVPEWTQQIPGLRGVWSTRWLDARWDGKQPDYSLLVRSEYALWAEGQARVHEVDEFVRFKDLPVEEREDEVLRPDAISKVSAVGRFYSGQEQLALYDVVVDYGEVEQQGGSLKQVTLSHTPGGTPPVTIGSESPDPPPPVEWWTVAAGTYNGANDYHLYVHLEYENFTPSSETVHFEFTNITRVPDGRPIRGVPVESERQERGGKPR